MKKHHEQLLVAALAGLVILGAASFAIGPALAETVGPIDPGIRISTVSRSEKGFYAQHRQETATPANPAPGVIESLPV